MGLITRNGTNNGKIVKSSGKTAAPSETPEKGGIVQSGRTTPTNDAASIATEPRKAKKAMALKTPTKKISKTKTPIMAKSTIEDKGKVQALENALSQIDKAFGSGAIMRLNGDDVSAIPAISTGAISLDLALGGRGMPRGRIIEVFGPESSGKTTLALNVVAQAQKGGVAAFIDAEHALDPMWAKKLGVDIDALLVSQPDTGEQALEICEMLVRSNAVDIVVIDSVAALIPRAEIEGEMGDTHVGLQARLMSQAMRKLTGAIAKSDCMVIFINQIREKIGVMFGSPETTPGGRALKFYSSIRVDIRRIGTIKDGDVAIGNRVRTRVVKNKTAPPFRTAEFDIMFNEGISIAGDLLDLAVEDEIVDKSGSWFSYGEVRLGQGRENSKKHIADNPEMFEEIKQKVLIARGVSEGAQGKEAPKTEKTAKTLEAAKPKEKPEGTEPTK
jgi:recombination protein RecA